MMTHHKPVKVEIFFQGYCGSDPGESSLCVPRVTALPTDDDIGSLTLHR